MKRYAWTLAMYVLGCASTTTGVMAPDSGAADVATVDAAVCAPLTCWNLERATFALPARGACTTDGDCVVRRFESDRSGTIEIVGVPVASVADFDQTAMTCASSGGIPPLHPFYEGGAPASSRDAPAVALCRSGCCVAVPPGADAGAPPDADAATTTDVTSPHGPPDE